MKQLMVTLMSLIFLFQACVQAPKQVEEEPVPTGFDTSTYTERGFELVLATKQALSKNLVGAITDQGTEHALEFCSTKAIALTDSMSDVLEAAIKRVSDQARNPKNEAKGEELEYIRRGKEQIAAGHKLTPELHDQGDKIIGYYPIMTNALCLQCHGESETQILSSSMILIDSLYPDDRAIGYRENELRGIFVVEMEKSE